ncbi:SRPBCC family protein [Promicromonospora sp. NPDC023987]|uniref:SRPBCC family protein n=1 Tax=Promicromonospora aerolata TaxID=195749 RepID=A0ABW4VGQ4_9MICO
MFALESVWRPAAPVAQVWPLLADPRFTWPDWWPGLTAAATHSVVGPDGLAAPGTWAHLRVRSPLGYALRFRLDLVRTTAPSDGEPGRAGLDVSGDLSGRADVTVSATATPGATEVTLLWQVSPVPVWFRAAARISPGPLARAHAHVMRAGERGLAARLAT